MRRAPRVLALRRSTAVRALGATLLLFVGADHLYEYAIGDYSVLPTIGTLFLLNFVSATAMGLILLAPLGRILGRFHRTALQLATASGVAIAGSSLVGLLLSEQTRLFGFMEVNYRPAIIIAIASEASAAIVLALSALMSGRPSSGSGPAAVTSLPSS